MKKAVRIVRVVSLLIAVWCSKFVYAQHNALKSGQVVVVTTPGWNSVQGTLSVWESNGRKWKPVIRDIPVVVGRSGLAWGVNNGIGPHLTGKQKKEGDGNAPAGIFPLTGLFGYEDISAKMNSLKVTTSTFCVDDTASKNYNRLVNTDTLVRDWTSAETMRMKSDAYKFGIFTGYNMLDPVPGKGSCIFMHIWQSPQRGTAGCTAMTEESVLRLIALLDSSKRPLLVQLPETEYKKVRKRFNLP